MNKETQTILISSAIALTLIIGVVFLFVALVDNKYVTALISSISYTLCIIASVVSLKVKNDISK